MPIFCLLQSRGCGITSFAGKDMFVESMTLEPVAVAFDVDHLAVMEQSVKDG